EFRLMPGVRPVVISEENFSKLLQGGHSFEEYFRYLDEQNYIDAQAKLLPATEIETLPEREESEQSDESNQSSQSSQNSQSAQSSQSSQSSQSPQSPQSSPSTPSTPKTPTYAPGTEGDEDSDELLF
ncbi:MAG: hypothetical protein K2F74_03190, partial [Muribaculaceae bacterium]|nr:hypothetical protein [Muribaculaceae bacterium]